MSSRIVSILGATGLQGASVLNAVLADGTFTPRAVTRNTESEAALKLKARGVEVVKGDMWDKASLVSAFIGSEAVFGLTNFFDPTIFPDNPTGEITQGKNMIDAAKEAGVKFFVFSSLPQPSKVSGGKYTNIVHFENKAAVQQYLQSSGLANASILLGGFLENFWTFKLLRKTDTGMTVAVPKYQPGTVEGMTWVTRDVGPSVLGLLKHYDNPSKDVSGKEYPILTARMSYGALAEMTAKTLGIEVTFSSPDSAGLPVLDDMLSYQAEFGFATDTPAPNPALVALGVQFSTVEEFMETEVKTRFG
ncbi:hypothetical protein B0H10DRAFT_2138210 [Mycena sp. CBHHK59/15]|nr:hypothetical protein B0H10DRAFT_2138210 [Mycena sp. CBHHK59/15]